MVELSTDPAAGIIAEMTQFPLSGKLPREFPCDQTPSKPST